MKLAIDIRRVAVIAGVAALLLIYAILWQQMITSRSERTGTDFIAFYAAGRVAQADGADRVYRPELQQAVQQEQVGFDLAPGQVLLYNHMPYLIPVLAVLVSGNYVASFVRWAILMLIVYAISAGVIARLFSRRGFQRNDIALLAAGMLTFFPLFVSILNGQDTAILFLGTCLWLAGLLLERDPLAGLGLALTTIRPNLAIFLAVPFLFRRQRVFLWFCLGAAAFSLVSLLVLGFGGVRSYIDVLLATAGGSWYGMKESAMLNLTGLLIRALPWLDVSLVHWIAWGAYFLGMAGLCVVWVRSKRIAERQIGLAVVLAVFTVPHLHYHDLTLLIIPLLAVLLLFGEKARQRFGFFLFLGLSLLFLFTNGISDLKYGLPYLVMGCIFLLLVISDKIFLGSDSKKPAQTQIKIT